MPIRGRYLPLLVRFFSLLYRPTTIRRRSGKQALILTEIGHLNNPPKDFALIVKEGGGVAMRSLECVSVSGYSNLFVSAKSSSAVRTDRGDFW